MLLEPQAYPDAASRREGTKTGSQTTLTTDDAGAYRFEAVGAINHRLSVDEATLPFADPILTTTRRTYSLNVPQGFIAPNVDFG